MNYLHVFNEFIIIFAPKPFNMTLQKWSNHTPWIDNAQIEQDLIICRALVSIFSDAYPLIYETFIDKMEGKRD